MSSATSRGLRLFSPDDETAAGETPTDGAAGGEPVTFEVSIGCNFFEADTFSVSQPIEMVGAISAE